MTTTINMHPAHDKEGILCVEIEEMPLGNGGPLFTVLRVRFADEKNHISFFPNMSVEELLQMFPTATVTRTPR